jgi:hypothetical protein
MVNKFHSHNIIMYIIYNKTTIINQILILYNFGQGHPVKAIQTKKTVELGII